MPLVWFCLVCDPPTKLVLLGLTADWPVQRRLLEIVLQRLLPAGGGQQQEWVVAWQKESVAPHDHRPISKRVRLTERK